ncbi:MAG TPA: GNAT family N-acetyltransferase [Roseiflexaceae bacterium]|nr:GNAT family N-acetyltransferase [Roseiflexaceae bacterium]HMP40630.1 GNAT family N-acetyltransferase [Roseiflexaceae bacterium]
MSLIDRVQQYLRTAARSQYQAIAVAPYTLFINPRDLLTYQNYAIPDEPVQGDQQATLAQVKQAFATRARRARFEFVREYAEALPAQLISTGFVEEGSYPLLICTPGNLCIPAIPADLSFVVYDDQAPAEALLLTLMINEQGFNEADAASFSRDDIERFRGVIRGGRAFVALLDDQPVASGMFNKPHNGLCELVGITTLSAFRGRGIAAALTAWMTQYAFALGVELTFLSAADEHATRVYERVGYRRQATLVAYVVPPFYSQVQKD